MKYFSLIIVTLLISFSLNAQKESMEDKVNRMMEVTGGKSSFELVINQMIEQQRGYYSDILPNEFFDELKREINENGYEEILQKLIPVYVENFTEKEIDDILEFYETPSGQAFISKTPIIMSESMSIGAEWGENIAKEIVERMEDAKNAKNDNFLKDHDLEECNKFKTGSFRFVGADGIEYNFKRSKKEQTQKLEKGMEITNKIEWLSDCRYRLYESDDNGKALKEIYSEYNIIEVKENSYVTLCKNHNMTEYFEIEFFMEK